MNNQGELMIELSGQEALIVVYMILVVVYCIIRTIFNAEDYHEELPKRRKDYKTNFDYYEAWMGVWFKKDFIISLFFPLFFIKWTIEHLESKPEE